MRKRFSACKNGYASWQCGTIVDKQEICERVEKSGQSDSVNLESKYWKIYGKIIHKKENKNKKIGYENIKKWETGWYSRIGSLSTKTLLYNYYPQYYINFKNNSKQIEKLFKNCKFLLVCPPPQWIAAPFRRSARRPLCPMDLPHLHCVPLQRVHVRSVRFWRHACQRYAVFRVAGVEWHAKFYFWFL